MATNAPVEAKVKASTTGAFLVGLLLMVLNEMHADGTLLAPLPAWLQAAVLGLLPPAVTFLSGWQARHTARGPAGV